jgi:hypothetical protein
MKKFFLFAAAALMALVGCEKQVQSSLELGDVQKKAHITGQLLYLDTRVGANTVPVELGNQRIYFQVEASKYADKSGGNLYFDATTDEKGNFDIEVPTGAKGIKGDLKTDLIKLTDASNNVVYLKNFSREVTVVADQNAVNQVIVKVDEVLSDMPDEVGIEGRVTYDGGYVENADKSLEKNDKAQAPDGTKVAVTVTYKDQDSKDASRVFIFSTSKGVFKGTLPVPSEISKKFDGTVKVNEFQADYGKLNKRDNKVEVLKGEWFQHDGAAKAISVQAGNHIFVEDIAAKRVSKDAPAERNTEILVKGKISYQTETLKKSEEDDKKDLITNADWAYPAYTKELNKGAFTLHVKNSTTGVELDYDLNITEDDGSFEKKVLVYDDWSWGDVKIWIEVKKFAVTDYVHYYKIAKYGSDKKWEDFYDVWNEVDGSGKQTAKWYSSDGDIKGTYEGKSSEISPDGFFDVEIPELQLAFTMHETSKKWLKGYGLTNPETGKKIDENKDGKQIYGHDPVATRIVKY